MGSVDGYEKKVFARYMEIYAAFAEVTDYEIGRFLNSIEALGEMDNTLVFYITGDNGSVFQGGPDRRLQRTVRVQRTARTPRHRSAAL